MSPGALKTYTPDGVVGIEEPWTLRLTSRTLYIVTGFLQSATNTTDVEGRSGWTKPYRAGFLLSALNTVVLIKILKISWA